MAEMNVTAFKASCLEVMNRIEKTREEVIITKRGKPIARLLPVERTQEAALFGSLKGTFKIPDDLLLKPAAPVDDWNVARECGEK
jgi:prevent-host-death family protein